MPTVNFLPLEVRFKPSGKWWIAEAPEIGVITQGETFERAKDNLADALDAFFQSCLSRGVLEAVLLEAGFSKVRCRRFQATAEERFPVHNHQRNECRA